MKLTQVCGLSPHPADDAPVTNAMATALRGAHVINGALEWRVPDPRHHPYAARIVFRGRDPEQWFPPKPRRHSHAERLGAPP